MSEVDQQPPLLPTEVVRGLVAHFLPRGAKTAHGRSRPEYLAEPLRSVKYASDIDKVRRGVSGDKLRRKAFEGKL